MKNYITKQEICKYGYNFEDKQFEKMFLEFLNEELAVEVGATISKLLSPEQIKEINRLAEDTSEENTATITALLAETVPNSSMIVEKSLKRFYRHLRFNRKAIMKKYQQYKEATT